MPTLVVEATEVTPEEVIDSFTSRTNAPAEGLLLAPEEANAKRVQVERSTEAAVQVLERLYTTIYFLLGKLEGRLVQVLIDTGCTTNPLSK